MAVQSRHFDPHRQRGHEWWERKIDHICKFLFAYLVLGGKRWGGCLREPPAPLFVLFASCFNSFNIQGHLFLPIRMSLPWFACHLFFSCLRSLSPSSIYFISSLLLPHASNRLVKRIVRASSHFYFFLLEKKKNVRVMSGVVCLLGSCKTPQSRVGSHSSSLYRNPLSGSPSPLQSYLLYSVWNMYCCCSLPPYFLLFIFYYFLFLFTCLSVLRLLTPPGISTHPER